MEIMSAALTLTFTDENAEVINIALMLYSRFIRSLGTSASTQDNRKKLLEIIKNLSLIFEKRKISSKAESEL